MLPQSSSLYKVVVNSYEKSILGAICYANIFDCALNRKELWQYSIKQKFTYASFEQALSKLIKSKRISKSGDYYTLIKHKNLVKLRDLRKANALKKIKLAVRFASYLKFIPWVRMAGISGAVAMHNSPIDDDIDLFIISSSNRLWLTRLLCVLLLQFFGVRRHPGQKNVKNKLCLNMFMDEAHFEISKNEKDLYSSHEIAQLIPIVNKGNTYERFLNANSWIKNYLPHTKIPKAPKKKLMRQIFLFNFAEKLARYFQVRYMKKRRTNEIVKDHLLRFHPKDARGWVMREYRQRLRQLRIKE